MNQQITRPILWNVPAAFVVIMYALTALWTVSIVYAIFRWYRIVRLGTADDRFDRPLYRAMSALRDAFGQGVVVRESWGWMHFSFYAGFVGLFIGTTIVLINSDLRELLALFGIPLYFLLRRFLPGVQSRDGHLLPDADPRSAGRGRAPAISYARRPASCRPRPRCSTTWRIGSATGSR